MNINYDLWCMKTDSDKILLEIDHVSFSYQGGTKLPVDHREHKAAQAVSDVSCVINHGEFLCLLGPSGCGKTTLLRLIAGLESPQKGDIRGTTKENRSPEIGMVFQDLALFPHMSVARNVSYALRHLNRADRRLRSEEMLELVGLTEKWGAYPHELSGGQKQRLAIARALARKPDIVLLDEPFAAQDVALRARIRDDVMHILRQAGVAAILVTHDPEEAMQFADRIVLMNNGRIEQIGEPEKIYNHPCNAFVASFFGQVNQFSGQVAHNHVATAIGSIPVKGFMDGDRVKIIIRPEALKIKPHNPAFDHHDPRHTHTHGIMSECKYIGRSTLVHLDTHDIDGDGQQKIHIHARVPGHFLEDRQTIQDIYLDHAQIFVFPDDA